MSSLTLSPAHGARARRLAAATLASLLAACTGFESASTEPPPGSSPPVRVVRLDRPDLPLQGANPAEQLDFDRGDRLFDAVFRNPDGLGPRYVRSACVSCHEADARGPGRVTRLGLPSALEPQRSALLPFGDVVYPFAANSAPSAQDFPRGAFTSERLPPAVFGRGALEAVADVAIERLAQSAAQRSGTIRGRIHRVQGRIGRFGLKAQSPTLDDFVADALRGDMGLTSPRRPDELGNPQGIRDDDKPGIDVSAEQVNALAQYVRLLEIPARPVASSEAAALFEQVACGVCHVRQLETAIDYPVAALAGRDVTVYTDLLLHDLGSALADGVTEGEASGREWRTAPLIGLRFMRAFLHDGRAASVEAAILEHAGEGSEANDSIEQFRALEPRERSLLLEHVAAL
jgi:CxxC motif-containing protein (DUF1111 family)